MIFCNSNFNGQLRHTAPGVTSQTKLQSITYLQKCNWSGKLNNRHINSQCGFWVLNFGGVVSMIQTVLTTPWALDSLAQGGEFRKPGKASPRCHRCDCKNHVNHINHVNHGRDDLKTGTSWTASSQSGMREACVLFADLEQFSRYCARRSLSALSRRTVGNV